MILKNKTRHEVMLPMQHQLQLLVRPMKHDCTRDSCPPHCCQLPHPLCNIVALVLSTRGLSGQRLTRTELKVGNKNRM